MMKRHKLLSHRVYYILHQIEIQLQEATRYAFHLNNFGFTATEPTSQQTSFHSVIIIDTWTSNLLETSISITPYISLIYRIYYRRHCLDLILRKKKIQW